MSESTRPRDDASYDDDAVEALLSGHGGPDDALAAALVDLRAAAARPAPEPSPALSELFGAAGDELARRRRRRGIVLGAVVVGATTTMTLSGVAAAHDALPGGAQNVVSGIINGLTPFHVDEDRPAARPTPTDIVAPVGTPTAPAPGGAAGVEAHRGGDDSGSGGGDRGNGDTTGEHRSTSGGSDGGSRSGTGDSDGGTRTSGADSGSSGDGDAGSSSDGDSGSSGGDRTSTPSTPTASPSSDGGSDGSGSGGGSGDGSGSGDGGSSNGGSDGSVSVR